MSQITPFETRANGKILLSGEYLVLDGALALACPVRFGQSLLVKPRAQAEGLSWQSKDSDGSIWFSTEYELPYLGVVETSDRSAAEMLASIIRDCQRQNPAFLHDVQGIDVVTACDFPRAWGLGTSSTIIAAMARWAEVDPYPVLRNTLGGSGYDIACAYAESPLLYQLQGDKPIVRHVAFEPEFRSQLYFVYLEHKQNSREGIVRYREKFKGDKAIINDISDLTERMLNAENLKDFDGYIVEHEQVVGRLLEFQPVKSKYFGDYWGEVKSLGAWGGDFVLATSQKTEAETRQYFQEKGYGTVLRWDEMM